MRLRGILLTVLAANVLLVRTPPALAHHSFTSEYDRTKPVLLTGTVTQVEWTNPHVWMHIEVPRTERGVAWQIELGGPSMLSRQGWTRGSVKLGDIVTVAGYAAKGGQPRANAVTVKLPGGFTIESGASAAADLSR